MSLFWREERREVTFQDVWGAGGDLSPGGSETLPALFAAHRTIVDTVASTPLHAFRETPSGAGRRMDRDPALLRPLHGTAYTWKAQAVASMVADGNAFGLSTGLAAGFPTGVVWLRPEQVHIDEEGILPVYFVDGRQVDRRRIVHIPWILQPGKWRGISPLKAFKTTFELGALAQEWGRDWFENDTVPPVHVKNSQRTLTDVEAQSAKTKYRSAVRGRQPFVSGSDWDLNVIGVPADEQRFIASLKLSAGQVATIYGLEPEDCGGEAANSLTYATTEGNERKRAQRIRIVQYAVLVLAVVLAALTIDGRQLQQVFFRPDLVVQTFGPQLGTAFVNTIIYTAGAFVLGLVLGTVLALMKLSQVGP